MPQTFAAEVSLGKAFIWSHVRAMSLERREVTMTQGKADGSLDDRPREEAGLASENIPVQPVSKETLSPGVMKHFRVYRKIILKERSENRLTIKSDYTRLNMFSHMISFWSSVKFIWRVALQKLAWSVFLVYCSVGCPVVLSTSQKKRKPQAPSTCKYL